MPTLLLIALFSISSFAETTKVSTEYHETYSTEGFEKYQDINSTLNSLECEEGIGQHNTANASLLILANSFEQMGFSQKEQFVCEMNQHTRAKNKETTDDFTNMNLYLQQRKAGKTISDEDHHKMTTLLIKYRMLRKKNGKEYYSSVIRHGAHNLAKVNSKKAKNHIAEYGPPETCSYVRNNKVKTSKITSRECFEELALKVQPIPAPLIVAQSVIESGWGTSELATTQSNVLGLQIKFSNPSTMVNYEYCRAAKSASNRCLINFNCHKEDYECLNNKNFEPLKGSVIDYFSRFNGSHFPGYVDYRSKRKKLYNSSKSNCSLAKKLIKHMEFYAENPDYEEEVISFLNQSKGKLDICNIIDKCENARIAHFLNKDQQIQKVTHYLSPK